MTQAQVKLVILRLAEGYPAPPAVTLDEAPEPDFDLGVALICPQCGSTYCQSEVTEGVRQARCNVCGCEFCQAKESVARRVVRSVMERQRHHKHILDIPTVGHKNRQRRHGQSGHDTELTGIGTARQMVNDRIMSEK